MLVVHRDRRAGRAAAAAGAGARGRRRLVQLRDGRRRHVDQRQLRASSRPARPPIAPITRGPRDPRLPALRAALEAVRDRAGAGDRARRRRRDQVHRRSRVEGGATSPECRRVAFAIAHSPLVKTAFFASDPNLGRIVCAIGYAGVGATSILRRVSFWLDDVLVVDRGGRAPGLPRGRRPARDEARPRSPCASSSAAAARAGDASGPATSRTTTCRINADYR